MDEASVRTRLEGALEEVEAGARVYREALRALTGNWRVKAARRLPLLRQLVASEPRWRDAVFRVEQLAAREQWPAGFGPRRSLAAHLSARARLEALVRERASDAEASLAPAVGALCAQLFDAAPTAAPVAEVRGRLDDLRLWVAIMGAAAASVPLFVWGLPAAIFLPLVVPLAALAAPVRVAVHGDRVRVRRPLRSPVDLPLNPGSLSLVDRGRTGELALRAAEVGEWLFPQHRAEEIFAALNLEAALGPAPEGPAQAAVVPGRWMRTGEEGALFVTDVDCVFVLSGPKTWSLLTGADRAWGRASAAWLGTLLARYPKERRAPLLYQLVDAGRAFYVRLQQPLAIKRALARMGDEVELSLGEPLKALQELHRRANQSGAARP